MYTKQVANIIVYTTAKVGRDSWMALKVLYQLHSETVEYLCAVTYIVMDWQ